MTYIIDYILEENVLKNISKLTIYDFGNIKGFLINDEFKMYKILNREDTKEVCELYDEPIPLNVFSIETYDCENFKTPHFTISFTQQQNLQQPQPLVTRPRLSQPHQKHPLRQQQRQSHPQQVKHFQPPSPQQEQKLLQTLQAPPPLSKNPQDSFLQLGEQINEMYKKIQREVSHQPRPSAVSNVGPQHQQWVSLEELMRVPLPEVGQVPYLQHSLKAQNSAVLMKQKQPLRVRRPQQQTVKQHQDSTC